MWIERVLGVAHRMLAAEPVPTLAPLASLLGCPPVEVTAVLAALGFAPSRARRACACGSPPTPGAGAASGGGNPHPESRPRPTRRSPSCGRSADRDERSRRPARRQMALARAFPQDPDGGDGAVQRRPASVSTAKSSRKAHHLVRPGDVLTFAAGERVRIIRIVQLAARRGPAAEARQLYEDLEAPRGKPSGQRGQYARRGAAIGLRPADQGRAARPRSAARSLKPAPQSHSCAKG